ncbi:MAG: cation diffusion facilitator family transporter, partial [Ottowia sp.]|nr:cation diffusion facilitator family transporter [Ottowia sp.]
MNKALSYRAALARRWSPQQWMRVSLAVALAVLALKTLAWALSGSVGLMSDALESVVNVAAALFGVLMLRLAAQPADAGHPFGHGKAEYFSSALEGALIVVAAAAIFWTAVPRLLHPRPLPPLGVALMLSLASSLLNGLLAGLLLGAAREHRSLALEADAQHLLADVWTSAGVIVGLAAAWAAGWLWMDALVALAVAVNVLREGARLLWRSAQGLMDAAAEPQTLEALHAALARFAGDEVR